MARDHGRIQCAIWDDPDFVSLSFGAQHAYMLLTTHSKLSYCGVIIYAPAVLADLASDLTEAKIKRAVRTLEDAEYVRIDPRTHELLVRSYVRHDGVFDRLNMGKAVASALERVVSDGLRAVVLAECARLYKQKPELAGWKGFAEVDPVGYATVTAFRSGKG